MTERLPAAGVLDSTFLPDIVDERSTYASPVMPILLELRRKHVVAAFATSGPHMNVGEWRSDGDGACACRRVSSMAPGLSPPSGIFGGSNKSGARATVVSGGDESINELCPVCGQKKRFDPLGQVLSLSSSSSPRRRRKSTSGLGKARLDSGARAPRHAEALLQSTPHLRHLSPASTDMQGTGNLTTSRNLLSFVLPSSSQPAIPAPTNIESAASSSRSGPSSLGTALDYRSCLIRDKANQQASNALASFLWVLAHEMSPEDYGTVENEVFTAIFALVHSADNERRMAGVAALDALIEAPSADEEKKAIKFANNLTNGLRTPQADYEFLAAVSKALGHMATGAANVDYVEFEVTRALEWLRTERSDRRLAASLTLKELAINAPTAFYSKTSHTGVGHGGSNEFLDNIFPVIRDPQPIVRACAADALSECLKIVMERQHISLTGLLCQMYFKMMDGLVHKSSKPSSSIGLPSTEAACHGSLLAVANMLEYSRDFVLPRFDEICVAVFSFAEHPKALIRLEVVRLLPRLARRCPGVFGRRYLEEGLRFLTQSASNPASPRVGVDIRPAAFTAIGQLVLAMSDRTTGGVIGGNMPTVRILRNPDTRDSTSSYIIEHSETGIIYDKLDEIFSIGRSGLKRFWTTTSSRRAGASTRSAALFCCADLVEGLGDMAHPYIDDLLDDMFGSGLSEDLIHCLRAISVCVPSKQTVIEDRLLQEVSLCLAGTPSAKQICDPVVFSKMATTSESSPLSWTSQNRRTQDIHTEGDRMQNPRVQSSRDDSHHDRDNSSLEKCSIPPQVNINMSDRADVVSNLVLCLGTLGSFGDNKGRVTTAGTVVILLPFVRDVAVQYLSHPASEVRRAASLTCCTLLVPRDGQPSVRLDSLAPSHGERQSSPYTVLKHRMGSFSGRVIEEVLRKLLQVAVSDPSPVVRLCVVRALDSRYDPFLCQTHHLQPLVLLLQDEALATRAAGLQMLGRLARFNPAPILPVLRRVLVDLIVELRCGGDKGRGREEAALLLIVYLKAEPLKRLVSPVLTSLVNALPLKGVAPRLASAALEALGELAQACPSSLTPWVKDLMPSIFEMLQDQSSASKQRTSLRTLGQVAGSTGYIITPYLDYPRLLSLAADILPGTKRAPWTLRREVIRTLGILGALDPDRYHTVAPKTRKGGAVGGGYFIEQEDVGIATDGHSMDAVKSSTTPIKSNNAVESTSDNASIPTSHAPEPPRQVKSRSQSCTVGFAPEKRHEKVVEADDDMPAHLFMYELYAMVAQPHSELPPARRMTPADEDFYPTVAIQALTRIFKDPSLAVHHGMVMQAIMFIFNSLGLRCVPFLSRVVPHIIYTIRTCGPASLREALLKQVATLSGIVREHLRPYVFSIFQVMEEYWSSRHLGTILSLVSKIAAGVPDDFRRYVPRLVRKLLASLEEIQVSDWLRNDVSGSSALEIEKLELILRSIRSLRLVLGDFMHVLVPALVKLAESLISPTPDAPDGGSTMHTNSTLTDVAVVTLQTLAVLLERDSGSVSTRSVVVSWGEHSTAAIPSCSSLPARAAQPLIRMLGKEANAGRAVGCTIVETLCVCAKQLGDRWLQLYDNAARDAIMSWHVRVGLSVSEPNDSTDVGETGPSRPSTGLMLYNEVIKGLDTSCLRRVGSASGISDSAYASMLEARHRQNSLLRNGLSAEITKSRGSEIFNGDNPIVTIGFDNSPDPLDGDVQNNPSIQPVLNQTSRHRINQGNLQRAWDVSQRASREDWTEWMRRFAIQLLREAPSPALRACASLAHAYQPLARELFSAAFVCCWEELSEQYRINLVHSLEAAFVADVSPEILQTLLNLAEFMEHDGVDSGLPIDISILADLALKCRAYAKALHYKEREHGMGGGGSCVEALISINKKLDLPEAALGVLKSARVQLESSRLEYGSGTPYAYPSDREEREHHSSLFLRQGCEMRYSVVASTDDGSVGSVTWDDGDVQESWLAKLGSWSEALEKYEQKLAVNPLDYEAILGCMRCLDARGEWKKVLNLAEKSCPSFAEPLDYVEGEAGELGGAHSFSSLFLASRSHRKVLKFCAEAAWRLGRWEDLEKCASQLVRYHSTGTHHHSALGNASAARDRGIPRVDFDGAFFSAILHIHRQEWTLAADAIDAARRAMDSRFTALMTESYKRAYPSMVTAQTLAEMEEIIDYRKLEGRAKAGAHHHPANCPSATDARERLLSVWRTRLAGCRVDAEIHSSILAVRSLVLGPTDEVDATLTLSDLSRQAQRFKLAERVLLDPLTQLGADLNGAIFGYGLRDSVGVTSSATDDCGTGGVGFVIDRLVTGETRAFLPQYTSSHDEYSKCLVKEAGTLERLTIQHQLYFAFVKHLWYMDHREEAMTRLAHLSEVVDLISHCEQVKDRALLVDCWLKLGEWKLAEGTSPSSVIQESLQIDALTAYKRATSTTRCGYKAWHSWALLNFRIAQQLFERDDTATAVPSARQRSSPTTRRLTNHVIAAVKGFVNAIGLGTKRSSASVQQDMLNLLTCLFKHGELPEVANSVNEGMSTISIEAWLGVLPQLLARIHIRSPSVRSVLHPLLTRLGEKHPQALMYPLSVLLKSPVLERKIAAESLMNSLKGHSNALVEEALMVSSELIRVAILWLETWHEGLEDASRLYFGERNVSGMLETLLPLHHKLESGAETRREHEFLKSFGRDLAEAHACVNEYIHLTRMDSESNPEKGPDPSSEYETPDDPSEEAENVMNKAWDIYYTVFRRINKQLPSLTKLELSHCSPALSRAQNLELGVPGSYRVDGSYVKIEKFIPNVQVITSKQRPRKITLRGNNGKNYVFLLKGHEDLRQDERVMQLFGLVNALLARDGRTNKHDLNIQRYAISPLSHNCGVVGWVPHCDTLHSLIRDYRQSKKVPLNMENREMLKMAPDYDMLTVMQKVEVFNEALRRTTGNGNDLYEILWLKSTNSEEWLERRTKYTRSLAVMSMVGYILGLGDRHPSNLMLDQLSGRVLHIDFGDCFEVAMNREKYPEKIPFRLTRMLVKAMEVSGIEGSYRSTCERTMGVLRDSRDSLVAMLEAFVYDPLISWRLVGLSSEEESEDQAVAAEGLHKNTIRGQNSSVDGVTSARGGVVRLNSSHNVLHGSIREGTEDENDDAEELLSNAIVTGEAVDPRTAPKREQAMSASRARSMQMYSDFQTLAAKLNTSSRIASITGDGNDHVAVEGSMAQSRIARSLHQRELMSLLEGEDGAAHEEALNEKALKVIRRVQDKLTGTDFQDLDDAVEPLDVSDQVQRLIVQATSSENLCQLFIGWCAFW